MAQTKTFICDNPGCPLGGVPQEEGNHIWMFAYNDGFSGESHYFCSKECAIQMLQEQPLKIAEAIVAEPAPEVGVALSPELIDGPPPDITHV